MPPAPAPIGLMRTTARPSSLLKTLLLPDEDVAAISLVERPLLLSDASLLHSRHHPLVSLRFVPSPRLFHQIYFICRGGRN